MLDPAFFSAVLGPTGSFPFSTPSDSQETIGDDEIARAKSTHLTYLGPRSTPGEVRRASLVALLLAAQFLGHPASTEAEMLAPSPGTVTIFSPIPHPKTREGAPLISDCYHRQPAGNGRDTGANGSSGTAPRSFQGYGLTIASRQGFVPVCAGLHTLPMSCYPSNAGRERDMWHRMPCDITQRVKSLCAPGFHAG